MSLALTLSPATDATVGREIVVTGSGFTNAGSVELNVYGLDSTISVKPRLTADGGGNITTVAHTTIIPWRSGVLRITAKDITAGTSITKRVKVSTAS